MTPGTIALTTELWRNQNELALNSQRKAPIIQPSTWSNQPPSHRKQGPTTLTKVTWHPQLTTSRPPKTDTTTTTDQSPSLLPEHRVPVLITGPRDAPSTPMATICDHRIFLAIHQSGMDATVQSFTDLGIDPVVIVETESDNAFRTANLNASSIFYNDRTTIERVSLSWHELGEPHKCSQRHAPTGSAELVQRWLYNGENT
jgi:hypothetical protein